jgi:hypothetical protein
MAQDKVKERVLVTKVLWVPQKARKFLASSVTISSEEGIGTTQNR